MAKCSIGDKTVYVTGMFWILRSGPIQHILGHIGVEMLSDVIEIFSAKALMQSWI